VVDAARVKLIYGHDGVLVTSRAWSLVVIKFTGCQEEQDYRDSLYRGPTGGSPSERKFGARGTVMFSYGEGRTGGKPLRSVEILTARGDS
jgi:hypothetical protein